MECIIDDIVSECVLFGVGIGAARGPGRRAAGCVAARRGVPVSAAGQLQGGCFTLLVLTCSLREGKPITDL